LSALDFWQFSTEFPADLLISKCCRNAAEAMSFHVEFTAFSKSAENKKET
jgi:hypothetical protein